MKVPAKVVFGDREHIPKGVKDHAWNGFKFVGVSKSYLEVLRGTGGQKEKDAKEVALKRDFREEYEAEKRAEVFEGMARARAVRWANRDE